MAEAKVIRREGRPGRPPRSPAPDGAQRLLAAAIELFPELGYAGTSIDALVTAARVTSPTLYHHYGTKHGLFVAAARDVHDEVLSRFAAAVEDTTSLAEAIDRVLDVAVDMVSTNLSQSRMTMAALLEAQRDEEIAAGLRPTLREFSAFFDAIATRHEVAGHDPRHMARAVIAIINGLNVEAVLLDDAQEFHGTVAALRSLIATS